MTAETREAQRNLLERVVRQLNGDAAQINPNLEDLRTALGEQNWHALLEMQKAAVRAGGKLPPDFSLQSFSRESLWQGQASPNRRALANMEAVRSRTVRHVAPLDAYAKAEAIRSRGHDKLREFIDTWLEAQPDFAEWAKRNPALNRQLNRAIARMKAGEVRRILLPDVNQRDQPIARAKYEPYVLFLEVARALETPARIGRCRRCQTYFVNPNGRKDRAYCTALCNRRAAAVRFTRERQNQLHSEKIERARRAYSEWKQRGSGEQDWRGFVVRKTGYTQKFLTRNSDVITKRRTP